ncbi:DUF1178 family protein [Croceicoccus naphthovorans]|uniref:Uncharacterized protein n=1 Tax=Croceicoccus naphthovorans TaxID=1348774 RepID=A0A0G3XHU8_9SPHN|nr:DUF1178 family protein [Croceicoccus naphthovorans]AKM09973.1 hypothetical protein AB433_08270 [Croceicoccus naphthovorans]MBB3990859.1 hypothetical protein [Croceicoccus naphthovorans]
MIVFDLSCRDGGHRFEAWFRSSDDFARQDEMGLLCCPECGSPNVGKAVMAPAVGRKGNQVVEAPIRRPDPAPDSQSVPMTGSPPAPVANITPEVREVFAKLAEVQKAALEKSRWVGGEFAEEARAIHYGERDAEAIHGQATREEVEDLIDEGVEIAPLLFPLTPPDAVN